MSSDEFKFDSNLIKLIQGLGQDKNRFMVLQAIINSGKPAVTMKDLEGLTGHTVTTLHKQLSELISSGIVKRTIINEKDPANYEISELGKKLLNAIGSLV